MLSVNSIVDKLLASEKPKSLLFTDCVYESSWMCKVDLFLYELTDLRVLKSHFMQRIKLIF